MIDYRLEEITEEDIDFVYGALNDPDLNRLARGPVYIPVSPESIKVEMNSIPGAWWIIWVDSKRVGWIRLTPINLIAVSLGIVIAVPEYRKEGLGFEVCWNVIYGAAFPLFREVHWMTWLYNHASLRLADKLGFEPYVTDNKGIILIKRKK
jgi:RimJ/RimL family protein N-acetyltransferase